MRDCRSGYDGTGVQGEFTDVLGVWKQGEPNDNIAWKGHYCGRQDIDKGDVVESRPVLGMGGRFEIKIQDI